MESVVHVRYFAKLRELAGVGSENVPLASKVSAEEVYNELRHRYDFPYEMPQLKVAINGEFATFSTPLTHNDELAFIPPVAGG